ncbi:oxygen-independent coproporphyrinogen III oxidase [Rapidithrix thailandica]|uniref:Coproporphyrinogen-III oxidase n=1 Tax=Rapidithrix thailandica TaxID=413964 RepID=A0AAW9S1D6_9BACT
MNTELVTKYNIPGPRYTSYPTVPYWDEKGIAIEDWQRTVKEAFQVSNATEGISLYLHLPFCESLCTFCGCNKRITKNHSVEEVYIQAILKEWQLYRNLLDETPVIKEIHLGGGTPTFFSPENVSDLIRKILAEAELAQEHYFSFEAHPNSTTVAHLKALNEVGFDRVSFGIQDFDPVVQQVINRVQSYEQVKAVTEAARNNGFTSVNYDIIYGLPLQKEASIVDTIEKVKMLKPDRIAYYSYAHVPWIKGVGQRKFTEADLPEGDVKRRLYEVGREMLQAMGYVEIGMDHFALPEDDLHLAMQEKRLHRNFMGYTAGKTRLQIGLGVSAISDSWGSFAQNEKKLEDYYARLQQNEIPVFRGHLLNQEDLVVRKHILNLMCHFETEVTQEDKVWIPGEVIEQRLEEMLKDRLVEIEDNKIKVTVAGQTFIRNICMAFDLRFWRKQPQAQLFSMTV